MDEPLNVEISGRLNALVQQRNAALDQIVLLVGQLERQGDELKQAQSRVMELLTQLQEQSP